LKPLIYNSQASAKAHSVSALKVANFRHKLNARVKNLLVMILADFCQNSLIIRKFRFEKRFLDFR